MPQHTSVTTITTRKLISSLVISITHLLHSHSVNSRFFALDDNVLLIAFGADNCNSCPSLCGSLLDFSHFTFCDLLFSEGMLTPDADRPFAPYSDGFGVQGNRSLSIFSRIKPDYKPVDL